MPYITEDAVKRAFVEVYNSMVEDEERFISVMEQSLTESTKSDQIMVALSKAEEQLCVTKQKIQKLIATNAHSALDQTEYGKSFNGLCEKQQEFETEIQRLKDEKLVQDTRRVYREDFIRQLKKSGKLILEFDIDLFNSIVEMVIVKDSKMLIFAFRGGIQKDWRC